MDIKGLITELLKQNRLLTPLEQDILDTYNELSKKPFDRNSAIRQSQKNNINHPDIGEDIFVEISAKPTTVLKPWAAASDEDVYSNLISQLEALGKRELEAHRNGQ